MSSTINLAAIDENGKTSFYTLNDQLISQYIDVSQTDEVEFLELKKCFSDKIAPYNRMIC